MYLPPIYLLISSLPRQICSSKGVAHIVIDNRRELHI